jgi:asparagine synthase (glutamine-hydrolysing)
MGGYRQGGNGFGFALRNHIASLSLRSPALARVLESAKLAWLSARGLAFLRGHRAVAPQALELPADEDVLPAQWGPMNRRLYRIFHSTVLPTILRNFDRLSMAHGVEVRMPFMDWQLVTYVMSLPDSAKLDGELSKAVARNAMIGRMPESIRANPRKLGFNSPMPEWLNGALSTWVDVCLSTRNATFEELVDAPALARRVRELTASGTWDWESAGRIWPYIQFKWILDGRPNAASGATTTVVPSAHNH